MRLSWHRTEAAFAVDQHEELQPDEEVTSLVQARQSPSWERPLVLVVSVQTPPCIGQEKDNKGISSGSWCFT